MTMERPDDLTPREIARETALLASSQAGEAHLFRGDGFACPWDSQTVPQIHVCARDEGHLGPHYYPTWTDRPEPRAYRCGSYMYANGIRIACAHLEGHEGDHVFTLTIRRSQAAPEG